jgi:hypothetical protein
VSASWILLDWRKVLNEFSFSLSDSHSQTRAKLQLRDHSSATFAEKFFQRKLILLSMFGVMPKFQSMHVNFARKDLKQHKI